MLVGQFPQPCDIHASPVFPSSYKYDSIVAVAAMDVSDQLGVFSNWGKTTVDIGAPGVAIMSTVPAASKYESAIEFFGSKVADWSGTSMATPHVAGAAALIWSQYPSLSAADVKKRLLDNVAKVGVLNGKVVSGGILDIEKAIQ